MRAVCTLHGKFQEPLSTQGSAPSQESQEPAKTLGEVVPQRRRKSAPSVGAKGPESNSNRDIPRILLLNPPRYRGITVVRIWRSEYLFVQGNQIPPMDLAYFAAAARGDAEVAIVDANAENLDPSATLERVERFRPDIIVSKGVINILEHDLEVPRLYKEKFPEVRLVLSCRGTLNREEKVFTEFPFLDAVARGEVDAFAKCLANTRSLSEISGMCTPGEPDPVVRIVQDLNEHPIPDLQAMPRAWYQHYRIPYFGVPSGYFLTTSRGCPYRCTFCMVGGITERPFTFRKRDPENVLEEVRMLEKDYGIRDAYIFDEIFTIPGHGDRISELFASSAPSFRFICEGKPDLVSPAMLDSLAKGGCTAVYYGLESGDDAILGNIKKGHHKGHARDAIRWTREAGVLAGAYVMLGFPGESWSSYLQTLEFLLETKPELVRYDFLSPYSVTELYAEMRRKGLVDPDNRNTDRRISRHFLGDVSIRSEELSATALRGMDFLFRRVFADELTRAPLIRHGALDSQSA